MTLRIKTILIVIFTAVIVTSALIIASRSVIQDSFERLEQETAVKSLGQAKARIDDVRTRLLSVCKDWAYWDDSYQFITGRNNRYAEENLAPAAIANIQVNFLLFFNLRGNLVFSRCVNLATGDSIGLPVSLETAIQKAGLTTPAEKPVSGIVASDSLVAMVAAVPILHSDFSGPAAGVLIAGRFIDSALEQQVFKATNLPVELDNINIGNGSDHKTDDCSISIISVDTLTISGVLADIAGNPALCIKLSTHRDIFKHGRFAIRNTVLLLLVVSSFFVLLIILILEHNVLRILQIISKRLRELTKRADSSLRMPNLGNDEFGKLTYDINGLLASLEQSNFQLVQSKQEYRDLFNEMLTGFVVFEYLHDELGSPTDLKLIEANPAFERIMGVQKNVVVGKKLTEIIPDIEPIWYERPGRVAVTGTSDHFEGYMASINKHLEVQAFSPKFGIVAQTFSDVTDRKNAELEKEKMQVQLLHAQKMEAIGTMAGGIAHDFNNLLCAIQGYAEMLSEESGLSPLMSKGLTTINSAATKGATLVKQLLAFGKKAATHPQMINLNELVEQIVSLLQRTIPSTIKIEMRLTQNIDIITADPGQIEQVLMNLAINSRDAMPNGGTLVIETRNCILDEAFVATHSGTRIGSHILLSVSDTGTGILPDQIKHIFEPFFTTKDVGKGTGLGLATVFGIIKNHNGYIECQSEYGIGTLFSIYLPSMPGEAIVPGENNLAETTVISSANEKILVIDDDEDARSFISELLNSRGYSVVTASNGREGIEKYQLENGKIDLVILDMIMPVMGGPQCAEGLTKINAAVKIIIASGYSQSQDLKTILDHPNRAFIGKPFATKNILSVVRNILDKKEL